jgi:hypothetical protein
VALKDDYILSYGNGNADNHIGTRFSKCYKGAQNKTDEMGGVRGSDLRNACKNFVGKPKEITHLEDLRVDRE